MLTEEGKWQPSFTNIIEDVIEKCTSCQPKHVPLAKPHSTLPKAMDFNDIISVVLKELQPEYRKDGYKYILYIVDEFSKYMKGILIKDKETEIVVRAVYRHWVIGINGLGFSVPTKHVFSDNGTEFTSDISEEFSKLLGIEWRYTASHSPHSNGSCERNHWTVDRKFEKFVKDTKGKDDLQRCLARAIFSTNTTPRDSDFSLSHILLGYAPIVSLKLPPTDKNTSQR